jgi:hypothetical protein
MSDQSQLQELARQVRSDTLRVLLATEPPWLTWAPDGTSNHILWHAGHALWLQDSLCIAPITSHSELPDNWEITFGMNCRPVRQTNQWPDRNTMQQLLQQQFKRQIAIIGELSAVQLNQIHPRLSAQWTLAGWIMHGLHDEAKHCGEMYLLWKMCKSRVGIDERTKRT